MELDDWKREALFARLNALQEEVDRDRFRFQIFGAMVIEMGGVIGTTAERMEPARKLLDSIAASSGALNKPSRPKNCHHRLRPKEFRHRGPR